MEFMRTPPALHGKDGGGLAVVPQRKPIVNPAVMRCLPSSSTTISLPGLSVSHQVLGTEISPVEVDRTPDAILKTGANVPDPILLEAILPFLAFSCFSCGLQHCLSPSA
jgi:hypothetical protein